jgi:hypothetical protein
MQSNAKKFTIKGSLLKRKSVLNVIPVTAAAPMAILRIVRKVRLSLMERIRGRVKKRANGPEKRMFPIMMETTKARDSMALLSNIVRWPPLVI